MDQLCCSDHGYINYTICHCSSPSDPRINYGKALSCLDCTYCLPLPAHSLLSLSGNCCFSATACCIAQQISFLLLMQCLQNGDLSSCTTLHELPKFVNLIAGFSALDSEAKACLRGAQARHIWVLKTDKEACSGKASHR